MQHSVNLPLAPPCSNAHGKLLKLQCVGEGGQGGILRLDFSLDGKWIRAEARASGETCLVQSTVHIILFSAESGDICEDQEV